MKSAEALSDAEARFSGLVNKSYDAGRGNILRLLVRTVANAYRDRLEELGPYLSSEDERVAGIASSAYHMLTGIMDPIEFKRYGGLGAIIDGECEYKKGVTDSRNGIGLRFSQNQLHFARLSGNALRDSVNFDNALMNADISGRALWGSHNQERVMRNIATAAAESMDRGRDVEVGNDESGNPHSIFQGQRSFGYYFV